MKNRIFVWGFVCLCMGFAFSAPVQAEAHLGYCWGKLMSRNQGPIQPNPYFDPNIFYYSSYFFPNGPSCIAGEATCKTAIGQKYKSSEHALRTDAITGSHYALMLYLCLPLGDDPDEWENYPETDWKEIDLPKSDVLNFDDNQVRKPETKPNLPRLEPVPNGVEKIHPIAMLLWVVLLIVLVIFLLPLEIYAAFILIMAGLLGISLEQGVKLVPVEKNQGIEYQVTYGNRQGQFYVPDNQNTSTYGRMRFTNQTLSYRLDESSQSFSGQVCSNQTPTSCKSFIKTVKELNAYQWFEYVYDHVKSYLE
ncbi:MAG: hypothetical protein KDD52_09035 [Bdellovibrionales bacterium]|nr:hypothetical protein [Bdellovibrionales bacterium]